MPQFTRNSYIPYEHDHLVHDWAALLEEDRDTVVAIAASWDLALKENKRLQKVIHEECQQEIQEVAQMLEDHGSQVYKRNRNGEIEKKTSFYAWFENNVANSIRGKYGYYNASSMWIERIELPEPRDTTQEVGQFTLKIQRRNLTLVELYDTLTAQFEHLQNEHYEQHELYQASLRYAAEHGIETTGMTEKEIMRAVEDHAKEEYRKEHLTPDTPVYFDECSDDCGLVFVGDIRCSCNNRKFFIDISGDILEGFEHWAFSR